jgi:membrane protein DedA with SNARE-associated domain
MGDATHDARRDESRMELLFLATTMNIDPEVLAAIDRWGPLALLVLLVMPLGGEEVIMVPAGFLVGQGHMAFIPTAICAWIGAFISDGLWYVLAYRWGTPLLHKKWFKRLAHPRRMLQAKHQFEKRGAWLIVTARFVPGTRTSVMIISGLLHMPWWKFVFAEGLCLLVSVPLQLGLGILISRHIIGTTGNMVGMILAIVGLVVVLTLAVFVVNWWYAHAGSKSRAPRAKARWMRRFRKPKPRPASS